MLALAGQPSRALLRELPNVQVVFGEEDGLPEELNEGEAYHAAFVNGLTWNALNLSIVYFLLRRTRVPAGTSQARAAPLR